MGAVISFFGIEGYKVLLLKWKWECKWLISIILEVVVIWTGKKRERVILRCVKLIIKLAIAMVCVKGLRFEQATKKVKSSKERSLAPGFGVCGGLWGVHDLKRYIVKILIEKTYFDGILINGRVWVIFWGVGVK